MARRDVADGAKLLWVYLADRERLHGAGNVWVARENIAPELGTDVSGLKRRINDLVKAGLVDVGQGPMRLNRYRTLTPIDAGSYRTENGPLATPASGARYHVFQKKEPPAQWTENGPLAAGPVGEVTSGPKTVHEGDETDASGPKMVPISDRKRSVDRTENGPPTRMKNKNEEEERIGVRKSSKVVRAKTSTEPKPLSKSEARRRTLDTLAEHFPKASGASPNNKQTADYLDAIWKWANKRNASAPLDAVAELGRRANADPYLASDEARWPISAIAQNLDNVIAGKSLRFPARGPAKSRGAAAPDSFDDHERERRAAAGGHHANL